MTFLVMRLCFRRLTLWRSRLLADGEFGMAPYGSSNEGWVRAAREARSVHIRTERFPTIVDRVLAGEIPKLFVRTKKRIYHELRVQIKFRSRWATSW